MTRFENRRNSRAEFTCGIHIPHRIPATARGRGEIPAAPDGNAAADDGSCPSSAAAPVVLGAPQRNELISMVSVRPGPTPIAEIGAPDISSRAFTYACAFFGRSAKVLAFVMSSDQPGRFS